MINYLKRLAIIMLIIPAIISVASCSSKPEPDTGSSSYQSPAESSTAQANTPLETIFDTTGNVDSPSTQKTDDTPGNGTDASSTDASSADTSSTDTSSTDTSSEDTNNKDIQESALADKIICIDPGHQEKADTKEEPVAPGSTVKKYKCSGGAVGVRSKISENELNLKVSLKLRGALEEQGAKVIMTRTVSKINISNAERAEIANNAKADLFIRIHADGSDSASTNGVSMLIPGNEYVKDKTLLNSSAKAGKTVLEEFVKATGAKSRGTVIRNDLAGFNWCSRPMILIEMGFLSNPEEDLRLNSDEYQDKMVEGMVSGVESYFLTPSDKEQ